MVKRKENKTKNLKRKNIVQQRKRVLFYRDSNLEHKPPVPLINRTGKIISFNPYFSVVDIV